MGRARAKRQPRTEAIPAARGAFADSRWLPVAAVVLLPLLAYANALGGGLVRDAAALVLDDPRIRELSAANLRLIWTGEYWWEKGAGPLYRPLTTTSFLIDYVLYGERPFGYHVVNVLFHVLNAALVYRLLRGLGGTRLVGALAAAFFGVHPIATEAVAGIAGRADLLAAAGVLGALCLHHQRRAAPLFVCALAGLLAKENAIVVAPLVVLLDALRPDCEGPRWRWRSHAATAAAVAVWFVLRRIALAGVIDPGVSFADNPLAHLPFAAGRLTALRILGHGLRLLVWPRALSADYSFDHFPLFPWSGAGEPLKLAGAAVALAGLLAAAIVLRRRQPAVSFLAAFLFLALLPTANVFVIIGSVFAERFLYLPAAAFAGLIALAGHALYQGAPAGSAVRRAATAFALFAIAAGALRTHARNRDWRDDESLFRAARDVAPRSYRVHKALAQSLLMGRPSDARLDEAIATAEEAVRILDVRPPAQRSADTLLLLGMAYLSKGDRAAGRDAAAAREWYGRARGVLERGVEADRAQAAGPHRGLARLYDILGNVCMRLDDPAAARDHFAHFRKLVPDRSVGYMLSSWAAGAAGEWDDASRLAFEAWLLDQRADAREVLAGLYRRRFPEAAPPFRSDATPDVSHPAVREDLRRACAALEAALEAELASRAEPAADVRGRCRALGIDEPYPGARSR